MEGEGSKDDNAEGDSLRRRGIGATLPVGWKHMPAPSQAVRLKIFEHIMDRFRKEEQESAERAARAEERKNVEEKIAWHKEQIADCMAKVQKFYDRKAELDADKSRLFAELKEVVAKDKAQKAALEERASHAVLFNQLLQSQPKETGENQAESSTSQGTTGSSGTSYTAQFSQSHDVCSKPSSLDSQSSKSFTKHHEKQQMETRARKTKSKKKKHNRLLTSCNQTASCSDDVDAKRRITSLEKGSKTAVRSLYSSCLPKEKSSVLSKEKQKDVSQNRFPLKFKNGRQAADATDRELLSSMFPFPTSVAFKFKKVSHAVQAVDHEEPPNQCTPSLPAPKVRPQCESVVRVDSEGFKGRNSESPQEITHSQSQTPIEPWYGFTPTSDAGSDQGGGCCPKAPTPRLFAANASTENRTSPDGATLGVCTPSPSPLNASPVPLNQCLSPEAWSNAAQWYRYRMAPVFGPPFSCPAYPFEPEFSSMHYPSSSLSRMDSSIRSN